MRTTEKKQKATSPKGGLLTFRVLNALPYSDSVKDLYNRTKQANEALKVGFSLAESCAMAMSSPFLSKYAAIDRFAANQLEKIEDRYNIDLVSKSVGAVAYPIGYSLGLAGFARNKVVELATPAVELGYEVADVVIDQLLPPDYDESLEEEYRKMTSLQQKSPIRRIKERATISSLVRLPSTAFLLSMQLFSSTIYLCMGFASMSLSRMITSATTLIDSINIQFEQDLKHPWTVMGNGDLTKLYRAIVFHGVQSVNALIADIEGRALELSQYLDNRNLPYNSQVVKFIASKLKKIERRLVRIGGVYLTSTSENVIVASSSKAKTPRRTVKPHTRAPTPRSTPSKRNTEERVPTIMHEEQPTWYERMEQEHQREIELEHEHEHEEHLSPHKIEVLADRAPTMMWGPSSQKRKANTQMSKDVGESSKAREVVASKPKDVVVVNKSTEVRKETPSKEVRKEIQPVKKASKSKALIVRESREVAVVSQPQEASKEVPQQKEDIKPKEATKQASKLKAKKTSKKAIKPVVWPKVDSKKFVKLAEANREKAAAAEAEAEASKHVEIVEPAKHEEEIEDEAPAHGHLIPQDVAKEIGQELLRPRKRVPVTPVNSPAEVLSNNPYGEILVEENDILRGPDVVDAHQAKIRDKEFMAHQRSLHRQALNELLSEVGCRLESVERRAEANAQAGPWQTAKHAVHVEVQETTPEPNPNVLPAPQNNPFGKLETDTTEDPLSMGLSTM